MPIIPGQKARQGREVTNYVPAINAEYSDQYKADLFMLWYQNNRPRGKAFTLIIPKDEYGRVPNLMVVQTWMRKEGWTTRANEMDGEVRARLNEIAIEQKVQMHIRHAEIGREIMEAGVEFLEKEKIVTATEAARLIDLGARMERESTGGAQALVEVSKMTDRKLRDFIESQLALMAPEDTSLVEGEVIENETTIE